MALSTTAASSKLAMAHRAAAAQCFSRRDAPPYTEQPRVDARLSDWKRNAGSLPSHRGRPTGTALSTTGRLMLPRSLPCSAATAQSPEPCYDAAHISDIMDHGASASRNLECGGIRKGTRRILSTVPCEKAREMGAVAHGRVSTHGGGKQLEGLRRRGMAEQVRRLDASTAEYSDFVDVMKNNTPVSITLSRSGR